MRVIILTLTVLPNVKLKIYKCQNRSAKPMRIDFLKTLLKVAECGSLKTAAESLGMSISTVSFQIKTVEEFYGVKIFRRNAGGVELTEEGRIVLKNAIHILNSIKETKRILMDLKSNRISIASGMVGLDVVFSIKTILKTRYPNLDVKVELKGAHECVRDVIDGKVDFAIVGDIEDDFEEDLCLEKIGEDSLVLIVPPNHHLATKKRVTLEDVLKENIIMLDESYGITTSTMKALKKAGVEKSELNIAYIVNDFFSKINAVSSGLGVAITSLIASCKACEVGLIVVRRIEGLDSKRDVYFVTTDLAMESDKLREYAEFIIENGRLLFEELKNRCCRNVKA